MHDPYVDDKEGELPSDSMNMPIGREQFRRMTRYGRRGLQAAVFLSGSGGFQQSGSPWVGGHRMDIGGGSA